MKKVLKSGFKKVGRLLFPEDILSNHAVPLLKSQTDCKVSQLQLQQYYRSLLAPGQQLLPTFGEIGFRQYSQFEEDGILLYLFSLIRPQNRTCLEICAGDGIECNTTNLIVNHGWWGHLFDGNAANVKKGTAFFAGNKDTFLHPPTFHCSWITVENVNELVTSCGIGGTIDLLSLDMDGNDYWVWKALHVVEPTVLVCEVQNFIPPDLALTIPYNPSFGMSDAHDDFRGASLRAMVNLSRTKGYRLVGTNRFGFNAFFVKNGVADHLLPEVSPEQCAVDPYTKHAQSTRWPKVKDMNWVKV